MDTTWRVPSDDARSFSIVEGLGASADDQPRARSSQLSSPLENGILAALERPDYERLRPHLSLVHLPAGMMFRHVSGSSGFAYFPVSGIVSPVFMMKSGEAAAVAVTGNDGMIGTSLFMAKSGTTECGVVQSSGYAYRLGAYRLCHEFARGGSFARTLLQYSHSLFMQMAQTAVCNRYHTIEQQFCRWLLMMIDRMPTNELAMTHERFARILGVRREGVTDAAGRLQKSGIIRYHRGQITLLDNEALQRRVCECYAESCVAAVGESRSGQRVSLI